MPQVRLNSEIRFIISLIIWLLAFLMIGQNDNTKGQTIPENRNRPEIIVQTGHIEAVCALDFSSNGKILASGSVDNTIKLWDIETKQEIKTLTGHSESVGALVFSPNGKIIASFTRSSIKLWNIETGKEIRSLKGIPTGEIYRLVEFSPDSTTLAISDGYWHIEIWNIETGAKIKIPNAHKNAIQTIAFSPNNTLLASSGDSLDNTIKFWDVKNGNQIKSFPGLATSFTFSADGKILALGTEERFKNKIELRNVETAEVIKSFPVPNKPDSLAFSPNGKIIAYGGDKTVKLWNIESETEIKSFNSNSDRRRPSMSFGCGGVHIKFSPDGKILASGSDDGTVKLLNLEGGQELKALSGRSDIFLSFAFSPDGRFFANGSRDDNEIKLWNVKNGREIKKLTGHKGVVLSLAFSPDGKTLASGSEDQTVKLWNIETEKEIRTLYEGEQMFDSLAFSPDGKTLAAGASDFATYQSILKLWKVEGGKELFSIPGDGRTFFLEIEFSPDGRFLASGVDSAQTFKIWDAKTGRRIRSLKNEQIAISSAFSPDGKIIALGEYIEAETESFRKIKLFSTRNGKLIRTLKGHSATITTLIFSPDGKTLASGSEDQIIKLWDSKTGQEIQSFIGHTSFIDSLKFSPAGFSLMSASGDGTIKVWNAKGDQLVATVLSLDKKDWVVVMPEGRFDTNKSPETIQGLHWLSPGEPLKPLPLNVFMRQYYEPGLLPRLLKCREENNCEKEFKPLP